MSQAPGSNPAVLSQISSKATTALIAAIAGFFCCPLLGIWAILSANQAQSLIAQYNIGQEHAAKANIGKILGMVSLVLAVIYAIGWVGCLAVGGFTQAG